MRNIGLLLKNYLLCSLGAMRSKKARTKTVVGMVILGLIYAGLFALMLLFQLLMAQTSQETNTQNSVLAMGLVVSIYIAVILALQKVTGGQKANDAELLLSMPIKKSEIMIAKALSRVFLNMAIVCLTFLPSLIAYLVYTPFSIVALLGCLTIFLIIPIFAVGLSYLVDFLVTVCLPNSKLGNVSKAIFTLLVLIATVVVYEVLTLNLDSMATMKFIDLIVTFNPILMLPVIITGIAVFIVGNYLNAILLNRETRTTKYKLSKLNQKPLTQFSALIKNEVNRYLNSPSLILNTIIGPIAIVALTIYLAIDKGSSIIGLLTLIGLEPDALAILIVLIYAFCAIMTYPAAVSISLEGKQFWILRSMPVKTSLVLTAKALFNILLIVPIMLICQVILQVIFNFQLAYCLMFFIIPTMFGILVSFLGVLLNLFFPKFEFESDAAVIKQSLSATIMMLGGIVTTMLLSGLFYLLLSLNLSIWIIAAILISLVTALTATAVILVFTLGKRIFNHL